MTSAVNNLFGAPANRLHHPDARYNPPSSPRVHGLHMVLKHFTARPGTVITHRAFLGPRFIHISPSCCFLIISSTVEGGLSFGLITTESPRAGICA